MFRIKLVGAAALLVGASLLGAMIAGEANAGSNPCSNISSGNYNVYTVKFTCGVRSTTASDADVVEGVYRTNINIHNPQTSAVSFCTKVVLPDNASPTGLSSLNPQTLNPDHALFIDCFDTGGIADQFGSGFPADTIETEGFVVVEVPQPSQYNTTPPLLDVVGKYTARPNSGITGVASLQVVVYSPTLISKSH